MFALDGVSKIFGTTRAVDDVTLDIEPGKTTALIGPSGCGKSTVLRLLVGLTFADLGEVRFDGAVLTPDTVSALRVRMGYVIQEGGLFPHMTARRNVLLAIRQTGWAAEQVEQRLSHLVAMTDFPENGLDRYPLELSGGQRQRVSLMRALMRDPEVLLLDEPFGALDPMIRYDLQRDFRSICRKAGKTVVIVTHDLAEAAYLGDTLVLLDEGRIAQRGTVTDLLERPATPFVKRFVEAQRSVAAPEGDA